MWRRVFFQSKENDENEEQLLIFCSIYEILEQVGS